MVVTAVMTKLTAASSLERADSPVWPEMMKEEGCDRAMVEATAYREMLAVVLMSVQGLWFLSRYGGISLKSAITSCEMLDAFSSDFLASFYLVCICVSFYNPYIRGEILYGVLVM